MERVANRIDYFSQEGVHTFRIKATWSELLSILPGAVFFVLMYVYTLPYDWIYILIVMVLFCLINQIGHSDYIFDPHQNVFSKRYGIGRFRLGESYRLEGLDRLRVTISPVIDEGAKTDDLEFNVENNEEKVTIYTSRDKEVIEALLKQLRTILPCLKVEKNTGIDGEM